MTRFRNVWNQLETGKWIRTLIYSGYSIEFKRKPPSRTDCRTSYLSPQQTVAMDKEINQLLKKEAIEPCDNNTGFFSPIFVVPKKDGGWRPIINLKTLNSYVETKHFKMEGIYTLRDILKPGDLMGKIDLKDAYFSVKIDIKHRKYLRFHWKGKSYQYRALPFGLATAP